MNEEAGYLDALLEKGLADRSHVHEMIERKTLELELEERFGLVLSNDDGEGWFFDREEDRRVWSMEELLAVQQTLGELPAEHLQDTVRALHRASHKDPRKNGPGSPAAGQYLHRKRTIELFDIGADPERSRLLQRTGNSAGSLAPVNGGLSLGSETPIIAEVLAHEIGHALHFARPELFARFEALAGWGTMSGRDLRRLLEAEGDSSEGARHRVDRAAHSRRTGKMERIPVAGLHVQPDARSRAFLSVSEHAIPEMPQWNYARVSSAEHFAELYGRAVHDPEGLFHDLVGSHKQVLEEGSGDLEDAKQRAALGEALRQFFRSDVFGVDDRAFRAFSAGPQHDPEEVQSMKELADRAMTPLQLERVQQRYGHLFARG